MNDINKGGEYRQYVINIYSNQSEKSAREGLMSFASEQGFEISDVENALQVYKYDTEENAFGENYYTKVAIANMIDMISGKYAKGNTIKGMQVLEISIEQGKSRSIPKVKRIGSSYPYKYYLGVYSVNTLEEANELVKDISDFIIYKIKYFDGEGVGLPKYAIYIAENKYAKGTTVKGGGVDTELKEALGIADGGGVFTQDFFDKYELVKETYSTKKNPNADELAKNRKKELQEQGFLVKMRKVSFEDLARSVGYFIIAVKRKNETYAKGTTIEDGGYDIIGGARTVNELSVPELEAQLKITKSNETERIKLIKKLIEQKSNKYAKGTTIEDSKDIGVLDYVYVKTENNNLGIVLEKTQMGGDLYYVATHYGKPREKRGHYRKSDLTLAKNNETRFFAKGTTIKFDKLPKNRQADKNYDYFAVGKIDGKIVDGWEIVDDVESLKYYAKIDLKDNDYNPKNFNIVSAKYLIRKGINPFDYNNWRKIDYSTNESAYATKFLEGEIYANGGGVGMNDSKRLENFIKKYNDTARKSGMYGFSKGDLMKMAYGDNYTNVDSALPMGLLREMRIDEADNYFSQKIKLKNALTLKSNLGYDFNDKFAIYIPIGISRFGYDFETADVGFDDKKFTKKSNNQSATFVGFGLSYEPIKNWILNLEYNKYQNFKITSVENATNAGEKIRTKTNL